jgi:CheY-like chemotaxis protein
VPPRASEVALLAAAQSAHLPVLRDYLGQAFERITWRDADDMRAEPPAGAQMLVVLEDRVGCAPGRWAAAGRPLLRLRPVEVQGPEAGASETEVLPLPLRRRELLSACARLQGVPAGHDAPVAAASAPVPAMPGLRCLLVEDNELNRRMIAIGLRALGLDVVEAGNGVEALQRFVPGALDIALIDVHMPEMDGVTLAARLRELDPVLPVYALTANVIGSEEQALAAAGVREVLYKPIDEQRLLAVLARHASPGEVKLQATPGIGAAEVREECTRLLERTTAAFAASDWGAAREEAHQLLGVARLFTRGALQPCCERLEAALRAGVRVEAADALLGVRQALRCLEPTEGTEEPAQAAPP